MTNCFRDFRHRHWRFCGINGHGDTSESAFHDLGLATEVPVGQQTVRLEQRRAMPVATRLPCCRSSSDRVAFAAHAFMIVQGFKLEAVGDDAEKASSAGTADQVFALPCSYRDVLPICSFH